MRHTRRVSLWPAFQDLQRLLEVPRDRAFSNVYALHVGAAEEMQPEEWTLFVEALEAVTAAWPQLEEVELEGGLSSTSSN